MPAFFLMFFHTEENPPGLYGPFCDGNAGLPDDFRPMHGLRHVYASMRASSGKVDMYVLQKLMPHKSTKMTQR